MSHHLCPPEPITETLPSEAATVEEHPSDEMAPVNVSVLWEVFGDDEETLREILGDFVEPASSNVAEINAAYEERSAEEIERAAHKLKSSSRAVGAAELADLCLALEMAGKAENWDEIDALMPRLNGILDGVVQYILSM